MNASNTPTPTTTEPQRNTVERRPEHISDVLADVYRFLFDRRAARLAKQAASRSSPSPHPRPTIPTNPARATMSSRRPFSLQAQLRAWFEQAHRRADCYAKINPALSARHRRVACAMLEAAVRLARDGRK